MKTIHLTYPHALQKNELVDTVAAIGFFDGVHKGHQAVIQQAIDLAKEEKKQSAVISFHPHPSVVLKNSEEEVRYITTIDEKKEILAALGVDSLYIITFNKELSQLSPKQFVDHFIIGLHISHLVAGFDYTFGHKGAGNMDNITELANGEFSTTVVKKLENGAEKVSSTRIRNLLKAGSVSEIEGLLGRVYETTGTVVKGDNRGGSQLGFPTANIDISTDKFLPKQGVYAVKVRHENVVYEGMANLGVVPTFRKDRTEPKLEVNIFDFEADIYGEQLTVEWYEFIRDERKFSGVEEIISQLNKDEKEIRTYFA